MAGKVADRESFGAQGAKEIVAVEVQQGRGGIDVEWGDAGVDEGVDEGKRAGAFEMAADEVFENGVIDIGEVAADIALEDVGVRPSKVSKALECSVGAVADAVGVGVLNEGPFDRGHDDLANGMMHDSIAVGCGGDEARLRFVDLEGAIGTGLIGLGFEFVLEFEEFGFEVVVELEN